MHARGHYQYLIEDTHRSIQQFSITNNNEQESTGIVPIQEHFIYYMNSMDFWSQMALFWGSLVLGSIAEKR